jgi:hypothetical protein
MTSWDPSSGRDTSGGAYWCGFFSAVELLPLDAVLDGGVLVVVVPAPLEPEVVRPGLVIGRPSKLLGGV